MRCEVFWSNWWSQSRLVERWLVRLKMSEGLIGLGHSSKCQVEWRGLIYQLKIFKERRFKVLPIWIVAQSVPRWMCPCCSVWFGIRGKWWAVVIAQSSSDGMICTASSTNTISFDTIGIPPNDTCPSIQWQSSSSPASKRSRRKHLQNQRKVQEPYSLDTAQSKWKKFFLFNDRKVLRMKSNIYVFH